MTNPIEALGGRKFVLTAACCALVVFAVPATPEAKLNFMTWAIGLYAGANVAQKASAKGGGGQQVPPPAN